MNVECEINHMGKEQKSKELKNKKQKDGNNESEQEDVKGLMASARATSRVTGAAPNNESIQDNSREAPKNLIVLLDDDDPPSESEVCKGRSELRSGCEDVLYKCNGRGDDLNSMREEERMVKMAYQYLNQGIPHFFSENARNEASPAPSGGRSLQIKPQRNILTKTERVTFTKMFFNHYQISPPS